MYSAKTLSAVATALAAGVAQAQYTLDTTYDATNFYSEFNFYNGPDPTHGFVEYVDATTAFNDGLANDQNNVVYMGVDSVTAQPEFGRKSVRVTSNKSFTHGLFIADIAHMPGSICGTWPAYWMFGPEWPSNGEIDIIEGVNNQESGAVTLHTSPGCTINNEGSDPTTTLAQGDCSAGNSNLGCGQETSNPLNYGDGFNAIQGGVYATEWTSDFIAVWFFPRYAIPQDITDGVPNPAGWGFPSAKFNGGSGCNIDEHFNDNNIIFDTTFCGDWAGAPDVWNNNEECSALAPTCQDYVSNNPEAFADAYWDVNNIKVYQQSVGNLTSRSGIYPRAFNA